MKIFFLVMSTVCIVCGVIYYFGPFTDHMMSALWMLGLAILFRLYAMGD